MRRFCYLIFSLLLGLSARAGEVPHDGVAATPQRVSVLDSTYEQRVAASPRNQAATGEVLVLPQPNAANVFPNPFMLEAGKLAGDEGTKDRDALVWQLVPKVEAHAEYLKKLDALAAAKQAPTLDLVDWCEKNHLSECAEFELRRMLRKFKNYSETGYPAVYSRWMKYADRRQIPLCFPLPVAGEWFTQPSPIHKLHSESTYAMDLVKMKDGAPVKKIPTRMEDYWGWGEPILAQADGVVIMVRDEMPDNKLGEIRGADANNYIFVDYGGGLMGNYAHLQHGSARFKLGDKVKAGDTLALVGASGAASVPHLHYTLRDMGWFSIQGRYRYELKTGAQWKLIDGQELRENMTIRNCENAFQGK